MRWTRCSRSGALNGAALPSLLLKTMARFAGDRPIRTTRSSAAARCRLRVARREELQYREADPGRGEAGGILRCGVEEKRRVERSSGGGAWTMWTLLLWLRQPRREVPRGGS
jgi:hypothetical protein